MTTETQIIIAFLYNRSGKPVLTESELYLSLSMDLGWMPASEAHAFIHQVIHDNLLIPKDDGFTPNFDITTVEIPSGFTPSKKIGKPSKPTTTPPPLLDQIIAQISRKTKTPQTVIAVEVATLAEEKKVVAEVAALWVARQHDCDVSAFYDAVDTALIPHKK